MSKKKNLSDKELLDMIHRYRDELAKVDLLADRTRITIRELIQRLSPEASATIPHDYLSPPKRKRGRPRKVKEEKIKGKRGRKKKVVEEVGHKEPIIRTEVVDGQEVVVHIPPVATGVRRGRPLKNEAARPKPKRKTPIPTQKEPIITTEIEDGQEVVVHIPPPALRGRPPKNKKG
jgi:hypothetical protein